MFYKFQLMPPLKKMDQEVSVKEVTRSTASGDYLYSEIMISNVIDIVLHRSDPEEFENALKLVHKILRIRKFHTLHRNVTIAMSIAIVGCLRSEYFGDVFQVMREWDFTGGCFWVIQEELLRHATLNAFKKAFNELESKEKALNHIKAVLPMIISFDSVRHPFVQLKCRELLGHFEMLIGSLSSSLFPKADLLVYDEQYPLEKFCSWFVIWAKGLLLENFNDLSFKMLRFEKVNANHTDVLQSIQEEQLLTTEDGYELKIQKDNPPDIIVGKVGNEVSNNDLSIQAIPPTPISSGPYDIQLNRLTVRPEKVKTFHNWIDARRLESEELSDSSSDDTKLALRGSRRAAACADTVVGGFRRGRVGFCESDD